MLRFLTAGESHGPALTGIIEGMPAGLALDLEEVNYELYRRQQGFGRGGRMQIESDRIEVLSGVRFSKTLGSPIAFILHNKDFANWREIMAVEQGMPGMEISRPRPGHADLSGSQKYGFSDMRNVLERSSARETSMRVAVGAFAKQLLKCFGIEIYSHVLQIGPVRVEHNKIAGILSSNQINKLADQSPVRCLDKTKETEMIAYIKQVKSEGDTTGGICQLIVRNVPPGLGSYVHWDRKLDGRLAAVLMSVQAVKAVELGAGFAAGLSKGSEFHDEIIYRQKQFSRASNHAGGIEGGMSNGQDIVAQIAMKPIPTLMKPLHSVDMKTKETFWAHKERSDITAVPACSVITEAVAAPVIANAFMEKFGADTVGDMQQSFEHYLKRLEDL